MQIAEKIERLDPWRVRIPETAWEEMRRPGLIYASEALWDAVVQDNAIDQVANVAAMPGMVGPALAMPDIHWGYGFPIGGVSAAPVDDGVVSPGGVGYDINCGVRLVRTDLSVDEVRPRLSRLVGAIYDAVPSGLGSKGRLRVERRDLERVLRDGARWAVENGFGWDEDLDRLEEGGCMAIADPSAVSDRAVHRGLPQLGSLGAGNHFLEVQAVDRVFDAGAAKAMGIDGPGQVCVMIHTGSRGLGYQVCDDQLAELEKGFRRDVVNGRGVYRSERFGIVLPDRQLACAPIQSAQGQRYLGAMAAAANYAWTNRQMIVHWVREAFRSTFRKDPSEMGMEIVYDVAHNIAKLEEHEVEGRRMRVLVHRKGATRSFGPGRAEVPRVYRSIGQPVLIPGDMGTASYLLAGTDQAMRESFGSTCHGAGRVMSRSAAVKRFRDGEIVRSLSERGIVVRAASKRVVSEEAPDAYKDVDEVVATADGAGLSRKIARLVPLGVVKG